MDRMSALPRAVGGYETRDVLAWQVALTAPGATTDPSALTWSPVVEGPGTTAAAMLRAVGAFSLDGPPRDFDAEDAWFRATLPSIDVHADDELVLLLGGIATVAEVWLDGEPLLRSENMFRAHERVLARPAHELVIRCHALGPLLAEKRPRPRWRAPMVSHTQLRAFRTTLLGRTPGWSPPAAVVGPWRGAKLTRRRHVAVQELALRPHVHEGEAWLEVCGRARGLGRAVTRIELVVSRGDREHRALLALTDDGRFSGSVTVPDVLRWWPHTHGEPALYRAELRVSAGEDVSADLGHVGFRTVTKDRDFGLSVNGAPIFCRGACWTPLDVVSLTADRETTEAVLRRVQGVGMNMLRVGGTMVYEDHVFHDLLDELGLLLWQDLMFANMDYPEDDPSFVEDVVAETRQVLASLQGRPSVAVICGNSEVEQQAAMFGAPRERWEPKLFHETLAQVSREVLPDAVYWPSSAHGGPFPHDARTGTTSYYGVGAYLRPLEDARRAEVRFATECLAFANVPERTSPSARVHAPSWKARTPRDLGAGWDFDDVRDHYVARLYGVDPTALRWTDHDRYLDLGRAATGEVMARTFGEWRRPGSTCHGGLVWFLKDLWPGAGWGVLDAEGQPKPAFFLLRRALAPVSLHLSDEGTNGVDVHVVNDRSLPLAASLEVALYRGEIPVGIETACVDLAPRAAMSLPIAALQPGFSDVSYAYRFGPPTCDLVVATLRDGDAVVARAFHAVTGLPSGKEDLGLAASAAPRADGAFELTVTSRHWAHGVVIEAEGFVADDAWFDVAPGGAQVVVLRGASRAATVPRGTVRALNGKASATIGTA
jgi:beta-mannosidase